MVTTETAAGMIAKALSRGERQSAVRSGIPESGRFTSFTFPCPTPTTLLGVGPHKGSAPATLSIRRKDALENLCSTRRVDRRVIRNRQTWGRALGQKLRGLAARHKDGLLLAAVAIVVLLGLVRWEEL
jgi:hypothetical protein